MSTDQMKPQPMNEDQLEDIKKQIIQTYLYLVSRTAYDPKVIEIMKLSALADVQRRFEAGEPGKRRFSDNQSRRKVGVVRRSALRARTFAIFVVPYTRFKVLRCLEAAIRSKNLSSQTLSYLEWNRLMLPENEREKFQHEMFDTILPQGVTLIWSVLFYTSIN